MTAEDTQSTKDIEAKLNNGDFAGARKATEELEARHMHDDCNMSITEIISALANKDAKAAKIAIADFEKWYDVNVNY